MSLGFEMRQVRAPRGIPIRRWISRRECSTNHVVVEWKVVGPYDAPARSAPFFVIDTKTIQPPLADWDTIRRKLYLNALSKQGSPPSANLILPSPEV